MLSIGKIIAQLEKGLPPATHEYGASESLYVEMRDGKHLMTRVYTPVGHALQGWPVVLIRFPYPGMLDYLELTAKLWTRYGYGAVLQNCRGTGESEGIWSPFVNEEADGLDTLDWLKSQVWMDGNIGLYGDSYLSAVQWVVADKLPAEVKALVISGFTTERYRQNYMNGMFRHDVYTGWALNNAGVGRLEKYSAEELFQTALSVRPHIDMDIRLFGQELPWYRDWITNVSPDDEYWSTGFWAEMQQKPYHIQIPVLMMDGWFDQHLEGMLRDYQKLPEETRAKSRYIIGPWVHSLQTAGDLEYPHSELNPLLQALEWFDHYLKGEDYAQAKGCGETYVIGDGSWKKWEDWIIPSGEQSWYLSQVTVDSGTLMEYPAAESAKVSFRYDPHNPVPTVGGAGLLRYLSGAPDASPAASMLQPSPGYRQDVISFISMPLPEDLTITGIIKVYLYISSDAEDTSFTAVLMELLPDGRAFNIRDGITSLAYSNGSARPKTYTAGDIQEVGIELWPITWKLGRNSRLRLDISSSNFPAYHAHLNAAGPWAEQQTAKVANQSIYCGEAFPSRMVIPF